MVTGSPSAIPVLPSQICPALPSRASQSLCLQMLGYKITKILTFGLDRRSHYSPCVLLVLCPLQLSSCLCCTIIPSLSPGRSPLPLLPWPFIAGPKEHTKQLPFALLLLVSFGLGYSFKRGQQANLYGAAPATSLLHYSSTLVGCWQCLSWSITALISNGTLLALLPLHPSTVLGVQEGFPPEKAKQYPASSQFARELQQPSLQMQYLNTRELCFLKTPGDEEQFEKYCTTHRAHPLHELSQNRTTYRRMADLLFLISSIKTDPALYGNQNFHLLSECISRMLLD